jgi:PilZ domain
MEPTVEHRKHRRYLVRFKSIFSTDGAHLEEGLVLDLSLGGCRLTSVIHVPSGIPIEMHIRPDQQSPIHIPRAVVRWAGVSVFGLEFKELPELESATLTRLLWTLRS